MIDAIAMQINESARAFSAKRGKEGNSENNNWSQDKIKLYELLYTRYKPGNMKIGEEDAFYKAIDEALEKYSPERGDFMPFFTTVFNSRKKDEARKPKNQEIKNIDLNELTEDVEKISYDSLTSVEEIAESKSIAESILQMLATICLEIKRSYNGKKRVCYPPLFFTDRLVYCVLIVTWIFFAISSDVTAIKLTKPLSIIF